MRKSAGVLIVLLVVGVIVGFGSSAWAATLSWTAPTTYTDGSAIPTTLTKTYNMKSGASSSGPWSSEGTTTSTSGTVSEPAAGTTKWYTVSVTISSVESANAIPVSKSAAFKTPSPATGLGIQ